MSSAARVSTRGRPAIEARWHAGMHLLSHTRSADPAPRGERGNESPAMGRATQRSIDILELIAQGNGKWTHAQIAGAS